MAKPLPEPKVVEPKVVKTYPLFEELVNHSIWFEMEKGKVGKIYPDPSEKEEIINIKRSVISALQVSVEGKDGRRTETEVSCG